MQKIINIGLLFLSLSWVSIVTAQPFFVEDIRVEGLQRISAGTVFAALPINVGDKIAESELRLAMKALFRTGNFENIQIGRDADVLVVIVEERPSISEINIEGNKAIETDALLEGLKSSGLAEGQVFKRSTLEGIRLELQRQYVSQGRYDAEIEAEVIEEPRNRVVVDININEGSVAKIKHINIVGNKDFETSALLDMFELRASGGFSFITGVDKYSKEKLKGDIEKLESFYLNRGYIKFNIDSTQVAIGPNRDAVFITVNITEGDVFKVDKVELAGDIVLEEAIMRRFLLVRKGQIFSQRRITATEEILVKQLGAKGFTFAKVNGIPEVDEEEKTVAIKFFVDPSKRTYVRRINFRGNTKTIDEVLRREMRQMEAAPADSSKVELSRVRLERLGFFKEVKVETPEVPGSDDLIDVEYTVEEQHSGSIGASIGYADGSGMVIGANLQQNNFLGSGNNVGVSINTSKYQTQYRFNYRNPYYTEDGVSRGFSLYFRKADLDEINISSYNTDTYGANVSFGYPLSEIERLNYSLGFTHTEITTGSFVVHEIKGSPLPVSSIDQYVFRETLDENGNPTLPTEEELGGIPEPVFDLGEDHDFFKDVATGFINRFGDIYNNYIFSASWVRSTLNRGQLATRGASKRLSLEVSLPGSDLEFYKMIFDGQLFVPLTRKMTLRMHAQIGFGEGYGDTDELPFYKNFFAGGFRSIRGYQSNSLGPRSTNPSLYAIVEGGDTSTNADDQYILGPDGKFHSITLSGRPDPFGGNVSIESGVEILFPLPFIKDQRSVQTVFFLDGGNVFDTDCGELQQACSNVNLSEMRYAVGLGLTWITAMGPLTFSLAKPFHYDDVDRRKTFQFSLGTGF